MKLIFSICKIFSFCFVVMYAFSSCKTTLIVNGTEEVPKKVIIKITGFDTTTGKLKMEDKAGKPADTIQAWPGQKIKWKIRGSGIRSIDSIFAKKVNKNKIFQEDPHKKFLSSTWQGTIQNKGALKENGVIRDGGYYNYDYNIKWKDKDGTQHTYDPRIQVKS